MAKTNESIKADERKREVVLSNARIAATGEVPFGYGSMADWYTTTTTWYSKLLKDEAFKAEFEQILAAGKVETSDPVEDYLRSYTGSFDFLQSVKGQLESGRTLSPKQRDAVQRCMDRENERKADNEGRSLPEGPFEAPKVEAQPQRRNNEPEATEGMYRTEDGTIYKVQRAVHGSGRLYAKRLVVHEGEFSFQKGFQGTKVTFEYDQGTIFKLKLTDKMTLEEAKAFGALYGTCCVCGRTLTDERSIEAGIGPVCAGKGEWA